MNTSFHIEQSAPESEPHHNELSELPSSDRKLMMQPIEEEEESLQMQPIEKEEALIQPFIQRQEEVVPPQQDEEEVEVDQEEEGMTLGEIFESIAEAMLHHPPSLSNMCQDRVEKISEFLEDGIGGSVFYFSLEDLKNGFHELGIELSQTEEETTEAQRSRYLELQSSWEELQQSIENFTVRRIKRNLRETRQVIEEMKLQLVLVYRQVYLSGEDSETEIVISETNEETTTLRNIADQVTGLLGAINDADAALTGRQVAPALTALSRANMFINLILGWNFTGELDSASQEAFDDLQNGIAVAMVAASFTAASAYLPLFGHIPALLGAISQLWDKVVEGLRNQNTQWWEAFAEMPYCSEEPGGCETLNYMISVFEADTYEDVETPPEEAADFFVSRRDMFNTVANEVMENWEVPTESEYLFFTVIDDERFKGWVFYNRDWIWKLIYGERSFPEQTEK
jgi:hypothetical protein